MAVQTLQGREQAFYRSVTGATSGTWEQNALDAWEAMGITLENNFNGSYIKYLQTLLNSDLTDLTGLIALRKSRFGNNYPEFGAISGQAAWYSADSIATGAVALWPDLSGNGNHATQSTGSAQPVNTANQINGKPALVFDGSKNLVLPSGLYLLPNGANTAFVVALRTTETGANNRLITLAEGGSSRYRLVFDSTAGRIIFQSKSAVGGEVASTGNTNTNMQIIRGRRSGTTQAISVNGGSETTNANASDENGCDSGYIAASGDGVSERLVGQIAEIIIYNRSLSTTERSAVELYLANKYGITLA